ncbi:MAG: hypothetical protein RR461_02480 [Angelakisella sp.]
MNNKLQRAFEPIRATEESKKNLSEYVCGELSRRQHKSYTSLRYVAACCVALFLIACGVGGYGFYSTPVSYISVDVNPSVELGLNRLDRVVTVAAYNDDGNLVLQNLNLKNKPYTEAVELLLADKTFGSYLSQDSLLSFTVVSDKEEALLAGIQQCRGYAEAGAQCRSANTELMNAAHESGLSFGKYQAFLELSRYDKSITAKDCRSLSMRELRDRIDQYTNGQNSTNMPGGGHHGMGQGNGSHGGRN